MDGSQLRLSLCLSRSFAPSHFLSLSLSLSLFFPSSCLSLPPHRALETRSVVQVETGQVLVRGGLENPSRSNDERTKTARNASIPFCLELFLSRSFSTEEIPFESERVNESRLC